MGKKFKYYVVQRMENGDWVNSSVRFFLQGLTGALKSYTYLKATYPTQKYRIVKGRATLTL